MWISKKFLAITDGVMEGKSFGLLGRFDLAKRLKTLGCASASDSSKVVDPDR